MKSYGETVREIRLAKGFLQKEIYTDVVVKSFAVRFEKGDVMLQYDTFLKVLSRLSVTEEEFQFIHNDYHVVETQSLWAEFAKAANLRDVTELERIYQENKNDKMKYHKVIAFLAHLTHENILHEVIDVSDYVEEKEIDFLKNYLLKSKLWTLDETNIFTTCYYIFDKETKKKLMTICYEALKKYELYKNYDERMYSLLSNYIFHAYLSDEHEEGNKYCQILMKMPQKSEYMYFVNRGNICHGLYLYLNGNREQGEEMVKNALKAFKLVGMNAEAKIYQNAFNQIKKRLIENNEGEH